MWTPLKLQKKIQTTKINHQKHENQTVNFDPQIRSLQCVFFFVNQENLSKLTIQKLSDFFVNLNCNVFIGKYYSNK